MKKLLTSLLLSIFSLCVVEGQTPNVNAGNDTTLNYPTSQCTLHGSATVSGGSIRSYSWVKVSGSKYGYIVSPNNRITQIKALRVGVYTFKLSATSNHRVVGSDLVVITVDSATAVLQANAGGDVTAPKDTGAIVLDGSASTGLIVSQKWRLITSVTQGVGICHIDSPTALITGTHIFPYRSTPYQYELTVYSASDSSKDTLNLNLTWKYPLPSQASHNTYDTLTAANYMTVPNGCIGCLYIDGANDDPTVAGQKTSIYVDTSWHTYLGAGKKILIKAGFYCGINLNFGYNTLHLDTVTNSGGQVQYETFRINNVPSAVITGKYVAGFTGNVNYKGHDAGYAFSDTTTGFYGNNHWQSTQAPICAVVGKYTDSVELSYINVGGGGFNGFWIKDPTAIHDWVVVQHDCSAFNIFGETWYDTQTDAEPKSHIKLTFYNNSSWRAGNEGFQFSGLATGTRVYNNYLFMAGTRFRDPFQDNQSTAFQFAPCNGDEQFFNNYISGAGEQVMNLFTDYRTGDVVVHDSIKIFNNMFGHNSGHIGNFYKEADTLNNVPIAIRGNYFGGYNHFIGDSIYSNSNPLATNTTQLLQCALASPSAAKIYMNGNYLDPSKPTLIANIGGIEALDTIGNHRNFILFNTTANTGFDTTVNPANYGMWATQYYWTIGDENIPASGVRQFAHVYYQAGDIVFWMGKVYVSNVNNNTGHMPKGFSDAWWTLKTWTNAGHVSYLPPDDPTVKSTSYWGSRNIGMVDFAP